MRYLLLIPIFFLGSCANVIFSTKDVVRYHDENGGSNNVETIADVVQNNINESSDTLGNYAYGVKRTKKRNLVPDHTATFFIRPEDWNIVHDGSEISVSVSKKGISSIRPLFVVEAPSENPSCDEKLRVIEIMTFAQEVLTYGDEFLAKKFITSPGLVSYKTIEDTCLAKKDNKAPLLCKYLDKVKEGVIKVIAIDVTKSIPIKIEFSRGANLFVCKKFIKKSELLEKRSRDNIAVLKITVDSK